LVEMEINEDERGFFARTFCANEFNIHGLDSRVVQCNISFNKDKGTLRGMHYQAPPMAEVKIVRCTQGSIYDVIIDLRRNSRTYCKWFGVTLAASNHIMIYIPEGFAHGFQTLEKNTEVFYQMSECYQSELQCGVRYNDPVFQIEWPIANLIISERDAAWPDYRKH